MKNEEQAQNKLWQLPFWGIVCTLAISVVSNPSSFGQSKTTDDNQESLAAEDLEYIVRNNVTNFLRLMEDLADYQIDPLADEMSVFFRELALIVQDQRSLEPEEPNRRKALKKLNGDLASLRSRTRKAVKSNLNRKQFSKYNRLIKRIAPPLSNHEIDSAAVEELVKIGSSHSKRSANTVEVQFLEPQPTMISLF